MAGREKQNGTGRYDVFNGDADGICALHQLRLVEPAPEATLVTGVKRDVTLLEHLAGVRAATITVLDISLHANADALRHLLEAGNTVTYIDHHYAGVVPEAAGLTCHIHPEPTCCTSLIVDRLLGGVHRTWALCGAFGDNLHEAAGRMAARLGLSRNQTEALRETGELLNYNGYGTRLEDLHFSPEQLYREVHGYRDPFDFHERSETLSALRTGFAEDMELACNQPPFAGSGPHVVYRFPDTSWARRISGVFANYRARENPAGAHALVTENGDGTLRVSVRAPLTDKRDADTLCRTFPSGGGRAAAAGINALPESMLDRFIDSFTSMYH